MKRIVILMLAILACTGAWAQLKVKSQSAAPESLATAPKSKAALVYQESHGYLMLLISSNRYDKSGYFLLGKDLDGALRTVSDLLALYGTIGKDQVTVEPWPGRTCLISSAGALDCLSLKFSHHAGQCELWHQDLEAFRSVLQKRQKP